MLEGVIYCLSNDIILNIGYNSDIFIMKQKLFHEDIVLIYYQKSIYHIYSVIPELGGRRAVKRIFILLVPNAI